MHILLKTWQVRKNLTSDDFLNFNFTVQTKIYQWILHIHYVKFIGSLCTLYRSFTCVWFCNIMFGHLKNISSLSYVDSPNDDISLHNIEKSHSVISLPISSEKKSLSIATLKLTLAVPFFQNSNFHLKFQMLSLATITISSFP